MLWHSGSSFGSLGISAPSQGTSALVHICQTHSDHMLFSGGGLSTSYSHAGVILLLGHNVVLESCFVH